MSEPSPSASYVGKYTESFSLMIGITILAITSVYIYSIINDFLQTFLKRPAHFLPFRISRVVKPAQVDVPLLELREGGDYRELLARGSEQYPDLPFKLRHPPGEIVILPFKYMDLIKSAPEHKLSFQQGSFDMLMGQHTGITAHDLEMATVIRRDVGRLLDRVHTIVDDEAIDAMKQEFGACDDWTEVLLLPKAVRMIVRVSQRVFVGEPLCRDERWIQTITNSTAASFGSIDKLWAGNWMTRPFIAWRDPGLRSMRKYKEASYKLIGPVLEQRLKDLQDPDFKAPPDLIQLVIDGWKDGKGRTLEHQVQTQFGTGRAALFTTGITVYHLIYDLATHPEYIEPLREEIIGLGDAPMNRANVAKLTKLDSFIRECQRWSKFFLIGTLRKVVQPLKLDDGTVLPVGTLLAVDAQNAVFNNSSLEDPHKFDGFRFERMRVQEGNSTKYQAVTTGPDHLVFGHGVQACPGRFFAVHEVKVALARILLNYDFKLKDKPMHSPMARVAGVVTNADPSVRFLFKSRK